MSLLNQITMGALPFPFHDNVAGMADERQVIQCVRSALSPRPNVVDGESPLAGSLNPTAVLASVLVAFADCLVDYSPIGAVIGFASTLPLVMVGTRYKLPHHFSPASDGTDNVRVGGKLTARLRYWLTTIGTVAGFPGPSRISLTLQSLPHQCTSAFPRAGWGRVIDYHAGRAIDGLTANGAGLSFSQPTGIIGPYQATLLPRVKALGATEMVFDSREARRVELAFFPAHVAGNLRHRSAPSSFSLGPNKATCISDRHAVPGSWCGESTHARSVSIGGPSW